MATKNRKITVTFEKSTTSLLSNVAHKEIKSVARLVRELTLEALTMREELYLSKIAEELDQESVVTCGHNNA